MRILVTGCAGFIGSHLAEFLLKNGHIILGIDNLNDYYLVENKLQNLEILKRYDNFEFLKEDIIDTNIVSTWKPEKICHLASMAGVRYSIENPEIYIDTNIKGFINILEQAVKIGVKSVIYASSSSVYGLNKTPFSENNKVDSCNSPYACSKLCMEIFAKMYTQLYNINCIGLRFFTVYGPRGRPDMAPYKFLKSINENKEIVKYGDGSSSRDYTYITDIIDGINSCIENNSIKCEVYNLGNNKPVTLNEFIELCEKTVGKKAIIKNISNQLGDVPKTCACIDKAKNDLNYQPKVELIDGLKIMYQNLN